MLEKTIRWRSQAPHVGTNPWIPASALFGPPTTSHQISSFSWRRGPPGNQDIKSMRKS